MKVALEAGASYHAGPRPGFQSLPTVPFGVKDGGAGVNSVLVRCAWCVVRCEKCWRRNAAWAGCKRCWAGCEGRMGGCEWYLGRVGRVLGPGSKVAGVDVKGVGAGVGVAKRDRRGRQPHALRHPRKC